MDAEQKLVRRAQSGDKEAFTALIEERKLSLSRAAMAILHNEDDAADAVAETVMIAFSKLCSLRSPRAFKTWLTRILINSCYDIIRQRKRTVSLEELPDRAQAEPDREEQMDVRRSLAELSENDRLVLSLYYLDDMSVREIAEVLDVNQNTVKTRLARGRRRFCRVYEEREGRYCEASCR